MKDSVLCFCDKTQTLRLMPSNYLVAYTSAGGYWVVDSDPSVPLLLVQKVTKILHESHALKWGKGLPLLAACTPTWEGVIDYEEEATKLLTSTGWSVSAMEGDTSFEKLTDAFKLLSEDEKQ